MKKFYAIFMAALVAVFVFAACGNNNEPNQDQPDVPGNDTTVTPGGNDSLINNNDYATLILGVWLQDSAIVDNNGEISNEEGFAGGRTDFLADGTFQMYDALDGTQPVNSGRYTVTGPTLMMDYYNGDELLGSNLFSIMAINQINLTIRAIYDTEVVTYHFTRVNK